MLNRFVTLLILLSVALAGAAPALAAEAPATLPQARQEGELDLLRVMQAYMPGIPQGFGVVRVEDLALELTENPPFLLDVRQPEELEEFGYIAGAVNIPTREVAANLDLLPSDLDAPIVVYCKAGTRGAIVMTALQILGFTNVRNMAGGMDAWIAGGYDVAAAPPPEPTPGQAAPIDPALVQAVDAYLQSVLPEGWGIVRAEDLALELLETPPFLLDVREVQEVETNGAIEGALNIPLREVAANLDLLPTDQPIVVYCAAGHRGAIAMVVLQMLGYDARNLAGGFNAWVAAGYDIVGGQEAAPAVEVTLPEGAILSAEAMQPIAMGYLAALPQGFASIPAQTLMDEMGEVFILDVREPAEYEEGYIAGAVNIPLRDLLENLHYLPTQEEPIVVYCSAGHRGALATMALGLLGYEEVVSLRSGLRAWTGELVTGEPPQMTAGAFPEVDADLWTTVDAYLSDLPQGFYTISAEDLSLALVENPPFLVDVREPAEYEGGHIQGAVNMPTRQLGDFMDQLPDPDTPIVMYGSIGHRSALTMMALQLSGYEDVRSLVGGSDAWTAAGFEMTTD